MLCDNYRCIFIHVPKTGGTSVERALLELSGLGWEDRKPYLIRPNPDPSKGPQQLAHLKASEYLSLGYVDADTFGSYFKFAIVRNPWDRLVSEYRYLELQRRMSFRQFVEDAFDSLDNYRNSARHIIPQVDYVTDAQRKFVVDFVGRYEHLRQDFAEVLRKLGLREWRLKHRNVSGEGKLGTLYRKLFGSDPFWTSTCRYQEYYSDPELREVVTRFYAEDIERFGYRFDGSFSSGPIIQNDDELDERALQRIRMNE